MFLKSIKNYKYSKETGCDRKIKDLFCRTLSCDNLFVTKSVIDSKISEEHCTVIINNVPAHG